MIWVYSQFYHHLDFLPEGLACEYDDNGFLQNKLSHITWCWWHLRAKSEDADGRAKTLKRWKALWDIHTWVYDGERDNFYSDHIDSWRMFLCMDKLMVKCAQCRMSVIYIYSIMLRSSDDCTVGGGHYTGHVTEAARQLTALVPCMSQYSRGRSPLTPRSRSTFALELETNLRKKKFYNHGEGPC